MAIDLCFGSGKVRVVIRLGFLRFETWQLINIITSVKVKLKINHIILLKETVIGDLYSLSKKAVTTLLKGELSVTILPANITRFL